MSRLCLAGLPLLAMVGCYVDAPQPSTLPDPAYVAGPPGGGYQGYQSYQPPAPRPAPPAVAAAPQQVEPPPADDGDADDAQLAGADVAGPQDQAAPSDGGDPTVGDPTANVSDAEIEATLNGYGQWIDTDDGQAWVPDATQVGVDFTPYDSGGSWAYSDAGWTFACDYPWGWLPFHYGRWGWFQGYWGWVPGHRWGAAWVDWRHGNGLVGWRPLSPSGGQRGDGHRFGGAVIRDHRHAEVHESAWRFATVSDFAKPHIRSHLYGDTAEGLRATTRVTAPPGRATATVRASDLMSRRFTTRAPAVGSRAYAPARSYQPPTRAYQPPARSYRPPQAYQAPVRSYQPPIRSYQPTRSYPQQTFRAPVRSYRQPVRTYQPHSSPSFGSHFSSGSSHSSGSHSSGGHSGGGHHR